MCIRDSVPAGFVPSQLFPGVSRQTQDSQIGMYIFGIYPVSYTHLDVYKRQDILICQVLLHNQKIVADEILEFPVLIFIAPVQKRPVHHTAL